MLYTHWSHAPWDADRWSNFQPSELACPHCGEFYYWPEFFDALQWAREQVGRPFNLNSAHRCRRHNAHVHGAPLSEHKRLAVDISLRGHDRRHLASVCRAAGFQGFGYYNTFLHVDLGRRRFWYGKGAKSSWL